MRAQQAPRGANLGQLGAFNQAVVLHAIRRTEGISRVELGQVTGLAPQTVTNICRRLLAEGLVTEGAKVSGGAGKPRTQLHINAAARYAVGVHLDPAVTTLVLLDLAGTTVRSERFPTPAADDPLAIIAAIGQAITAFIAAGAVPRDRILGVGAATPGPVDVQRGLIHDPPHLPGWHQVPVRDELARVVGLPVLLEKDVVAAATAESWAGTFADTGSAALLYLGTGIGAGLVVDGEVLRGVSNNAGEIGHLVVDPGGAPCPCGQHGCVNATLGAHALVSRAGGGSAPSPPAELDARLRRLYDRADAGEVDALAVVRPAALALARTALVVANLLDVECLVVGGPYWPRMAPYFFAVAPGLFADRCAAHRIHPVRLVGSPVGEHLGAVGAASLVLDRTYSPRPGALVLT